MSKTCKQEIIDEQGQNLLRSTLPNELFKFEDFGTSDNKPDIDGRLRLRDGNGGNYNEFLHFQLKSTEQEDFTSYYLREDAILFHCETNVPTLIFIANLKQRAVFWHKIDPLLAESRKSKGLCIPLTEAITPQNIAHLHAQWRGMAKKVDLRTSNLKLKNIATNVIADTKKIIGLIHLLKRGKRKSLPELAETFYQISKDKLTPLLAELEQQGIITLTANYILLNDLELGDESVATVLQQGKLESLFFTLTDYDDQTQLLRSFVEYQHSWIPSLLKRIAKRIAREGHESNRMTNKFFAVSQIRELSPIIAKDVIPLLKAYADLKPAPARTFKKMALSGDFKDAEDVIANAAEGLSRLLLVDAGVLKHVWRLLDNSDKAIRNKIVNILKEIVSYELNNLESVGFAPQEAVLQLLHKRPRSSLFDHLDIVCSLCSELLEPSYASRRMVDWRSFEIGDDALPATEQLEKLRQSVIDLLSDLFRSTKNPNHRERIIMALREATIPSHFGKPTDQHKKMVLTNASRVLQFFLEQLRSMPLREIYFIEEQIEDIERFFGAANLPILNSLKDAIAKDSEYQVIESLIGWGYLPSESLKQAHSQRIDSMFADVSQRTLKTWRSRLELLSSDRELIATKGYTHLTGFVRRIGREKPSIGKQLLNSKKLKTVLPSLLQGLEEAQESVFLSRWIKKNEAKYWEQISEFYRISLIPRTTNYRRLSRIGIKKKAPYTLRNILDSLVYKKLTKPADAALSLTLIQHLSELGDKFWTSSFSSEDYLNSISFSKKAYKRILQAILPMRRIEYHEVKLLAHIGKLHPLLVVRFLIERIEYQINGRFDWSEYDAIPHNLDSIEEVLQINPLESILQLVPLLDMPNPRYGSEANNLLQKSYSGLPHLFVHVVNHLLEGPTAKSVSIAVKTLRLIKDENQYFEKAKCLLSTKLCTTKAIDEIAYHIALFEKFVPDISDWRKHKIISYSKCAKAIEKYREEFKERRKEWVAEKKSNSKLNGIDEHVELRKRGIYCGV